MSEQVSAKDRAFVYERDGHRCVVSSDEGPNTCSGPLTIQHRADRGMGGTSIVVPRAGLVAMCWKHNHAASHDPAFMKLASKLGWKLRRSEDPHAVAIFYRWRLEWVLWGPDDTPRVVAHRDDECGHDPQDDWRTDVKVTFTRETDSEEVGP